MKINEILTEAGYKPGIGHAIGRGVLGAATGIAKMFDPQGSGAQLSKIYQATDIKGQRADKAAKLKQQRQGAQYAKQRALAMANQPLGDVQVPIGQRLMVVASGELYFKLSDGRWFYVPNTANPDMSQQVQSADAGKLDNLRSNSNNVTSVNLVPI
jgi:hypothetical protein